MKKILATSILGLALIGTGYVAGLNAASKPRVYELRTYYTAEGKLGDLNSRFRDHTTKIFEKHGMKNVVYGVPMDAAKDGVGPSKENTLIYLLSHESKEAALKSWADFAKDPDWIKARTASEVNGKLTTKVERVFLEPTDYSPMK
jgi:hypothetical protein